MDKESPLRILGHDKVGELEDRIPFWWFVYWVSVTCHILFSLDLGQPWVVLSEQAFLERALTFARLWQLLFYSLVTLDSGLLRTGIPSCDPYSLEGRRPVELFVIKQYLFGLRKATNWLGLGN